MRLFLLTFFIIYGGIHLYVFLKAKAAFAFGLATGLLLTFFMLIMILAPMIVHYSEKYGLELFARIMAYTGYIWGGILFLFFSASIIVDIYRLLMHLSGFIFQIDMSSFLPSARQSFYLPLLLSLSVSVYGYFEAGNIRTERLTIRSHKVPAAYSPLKIVQISDVHLGLIVREGRLKRILEKVAVENPDLFVSTGDLVDGQVCELNGLAALLSEIRTKYGKFAVTGNHEFYAGFDNAKCFTENAGFTLLRGEATSAAGITIAGVDDPAGRFYGAKNASETELLSPLPRDRFILLLKHRPLVDKNAIGLFDLQLSGHIHKGQIFPFTLLIALYYPVTSGRLDLAGNSAMYVSRGSGTWGPPIRFLAPPEVTVIELFHTD
jgi:predicted MPP superfamily phosphohydrolase